MFIQYGRWKISYVKKSCRLWQHWQNLESKLTTDCFLIYNCIVFFQCCQTVFLFVLRIRTFSIDVLIADQECCWYLNRNGSKFIKVKHFCRNILSVEISGLFSVAFGNMMTHCKKRREYLISRTLSAHIDAGFIYLCSSVLHSFPFCDTVWCDGSR